MRREKKGIYQMNSLIFFCFTFPNDHSQKSEPSTVVVKQVSTMASEKRGKKDRRTSESLGIGKVRLHYSLENRLGYVHLVAEGKA